MPARAPLFRPGPSLAVLAALAGCQDRLEPDVRYQVVGLLPVSGAACPTVTPTAPPAVAATRVRFTFRDAVSGALRCDAVLPIEPGARPPVLAVPGDAAAVDVHVEYFDAAGALLARGQRADVIPVGGAAVTIAATRTDDWSCPLGAAAIGRAFHSATVLPDGQVLLLGGLVADPTGSDAGFAPGAGAYVTSAAELYDPVERRFTAVSIGGLLPRAFHEVLVLGVDGGRARLVVVGGLGVAGDPAAPGNVAVIPTGDGPPWRPAPADAALGRAGARALPAELIEYDAATRTFTRREVAGGPSARQLGTATAPGGAPGAALVVVGGRTDAGEPVLASEAVRPADGTVSGSVDGHPRVGATVTAVGPAEALVWGGDLTALAADVRAGDRLTMLDGTPAIATGPAGTGAANRAFHAAAGFGDRVVVAGGLAVSGGAIGASPFMPPVELVDPATLTASAIDVVGAVGAAYPAAIGLHDGGVLFTGGAMGVCASTLACPSVQSFRIRRGTGPEPGPTGAPGLARYGHRLSRLPDGTILVTGGLSAAPEPAQIRALRDAELYDPFEADDDPIADLPYRRVPGDVARMDGAPVAPCTLVE